MAYYYETLGLDDHPADFRTAKKAYAKQLRVTRPDEDPEGFMQLREALDTAKREIAWREQTAKVDQNRSGNNNYDEPHEAPKIVYTENPTTLSEEIANAIIKNEAQETEEKEREEEAESIPTADKLEPMDQAPDLPPDLSLDINQDISPDVPEPTIEDIEQPGDEILMNHFSKAFNDPFLKNDKAHWRTLLEKINELSIDEYIDFDARFRGALINAYNKWNEEKKESPNKRRPLSAEIENLIFDKMKWRFLQDANSYKANEINWLKSQFDLFNRESPHWVQKAKKTQPVRIEKDKGKSGLWMFFIIMWVLLSLGRCITNFSSDNYSYSSAPSYSSSPAAEKARSNFNEQLENLRELSSDPPTHEEVLKSKLRVIALQDGLADQSNADLIDEINQLSADEIIKSFGQPPEKLNQSENIKDSSPK